MCYDHLSGFDGLKLNVAVDVTIVASITVVAFTAVALTTVALTTVALTTVGLTTVGLYNFPFYNCSPNDCCLYNWCHYYCWLETIVGIAVEDYKDLSCLSPVSVASVLSVKPTLIRSPIPDATSTIGNLSLRPKKCIRVFLFDEQFFLS